MKIVISPDKFKNSLSSLEFCTIVKNQILDFDATIDVLELPLADGGDGTIEIMNYYLKGKLFTVNVNNPFFKPVEASYLFSKKNKTAFIEMAEASGVKLLLKKEFDCKNATTFGTGEMILDAINNGAETIILGIGGSATNDCGIGMATALGYQFLDENKQQVIPTGKNLSSIKYIDDSNVLLSLQNVKFKVACDVDNPLYGKKGAAHTYAAQKGASKDDILELDKGLKDFATILNKHFDTNVQKIKGAGAAGGMGIASKLFLNGELQSGIDLIKSIANYNKAIKNASWIITGEGKLDDQTLSGKTISGILKATKNKPCKVAAICGTIELQKNELQKMGIHYGVDILNIAKSLEDAMKNSEKYLNALTQKFIIENLSA